MFKVTTGKRQFTHDVTILSPIDGGFGDEKLKTTFNALDMNECDKFNLNTKEGTSAFLDAVVDTFHDLTGDDDKPLACDANVRAALFAKQNVRQALIEHFFESVRKTKEGN